MSLANQLPDQWPDPKDYGLPVVEIKPIRPIPIPAIKETKVVPEVPEAEVSKEKVSNPASEKVIPVEEVTAPIPEQVQIEAVQKPTQKQVPAKKESNKWLAIAAILAIGIVAVIIWQTIKTTDSSAESIAIGVESTSAELDEKESSSTVNESKDPKIQVAESQTAEIESPSQVEPTIQKPETGTTIDRTTPGTLIRVESKSERPTYFIVVGSLPSERLALDEAPQYQSRVPAVYLISPYDDTKNYRLAIGSFGSFTKANEELERIKADYTEALWILKY